MGNSKAGCAVVGGPGVPVSVGVEIRNFKLAHRCTIILYRTQCTYCVSCILPPPPPLLQVWCYYHRLSFFHFDRIQIHNILCDNITRSVQGKWLCVIQLHTTMYRNIAISVYIHHIITIQLVERTHS